ncbi:MAG: ATP-binding cassette domain-containing protein [Saprospiraceae bacterium]
MISTSGLVKTFDNNKSIAFPDLHVAKSDTLLIHGPSGSGKTSLLHILSGLMRQSQGSVDIEGNKLEKLSDVQLDEFRGKNIGICLQRPVFIKSLTVIENLLIAQRIAHQNPDKNYCMSLLNEMGLTQCKDQLTNKLSQGEQQRLMFIRALINKPKLILADEPSSSLDDHNTDLLTNLMIQHSSLHEATLIVVSHDDRLKKMFDNKILLS